MKNLLLVLALVGFLVPTAHAETVLYCQAELATGFVKKNGRWSTTNFHEPRYTIKFNDDYTELEGLGDDKHYTCAPSYPFKPNLIHCLDKTKNGRAFIFHKSTKRFVHSKPAFGYVINGAKPDTEAMHAGTCQQF